MNRRRVKIAIFILAIVIVVAFCFGSHVKSKETNLCITEICPHNEQAAHDEYGDYGSDYIEIYNPTDKAINLLGWGLSDDVNQLSKFLFPDMVIEPGQTIISWSGEDIYPEEARRDDYVPSDVHGLGFGISGGERICLTDPEGTVVSSVPIPTEVRDNMVVSSARNDLSVFVIDEATPHYVKDEIQVAKTRKELSAPEFSISGGWYTGEIEVELYSDEGEIYYTLDGSDPDENSIRYEGSIAVANRTEDDNYYCCIEDTAIENVNYPEYKVDKATVIKAVVISDSGRSQVASETYFVGLDEEEYAGVSIMSLVVSPDDFFGDENGIYRVGSVYRSFQNKIDVSKMEEPPYIPVANFSKEGKGWERPVTIEYFDQDHNKALEQISGIRIHGGWSVLFNQKSFNIYAREAYDGSNLFNQDFFGNGKRYSNLTLRNGGFEDFYVSKIRDIFNQSLVTDRAIGTQDAIPCVVFINGEYWGLYNLQERVSDNYIWNHYGIPEDEVVIIKRKHNKFYAQQEEEEKYLTEYQELLDFVINNDMAVEENYRYIESKIDIQSLIDYYVLKLYTGCIDAYTNNEAAWRAKSIGDGEYEDGKWRYLANDLDNSANMQMGLSSPDVDSFVESNWLSKRGPLVDEGFLSSLIVNPEFKERFVTSFLDMMNNNFDHDRLQPSLWERAETMRKQNVKSQQTFRGRYVIDDYSGQDDVDFPYDEDDFGYDIGLIDVFYLYRPGYMTEYMKEDLNLQGRLYKLNVMGGLPEGSRLIINTSEIRDYSGEWSGQYFGDYPVTLSIIGEDSSNFTGWYVDGQLVSEENTYVIPAGFERDELVVEIR